MYVLVSWSQRFELKYCLRNVAIYSQRQNAEEHRHLDRPENLKSHKEQFDCRLQKALCQADFPPRVLPNLYTDS